MNPIRVITHRGTSDGHQRISSASRTVVERGNHRSRIHLALVSAWVFDGLGYLHPNLEMATPNTRSGQFGHSVVNDDASSYFIGSNLILMHELRSLYGPVVL